MNFIINIFLGVFLFGFLIEGLTFIKYAGLYGAILFIIIQLTKDRNDKCKLYYQNNKFLLNIFFIFLSILFLSSIFSYFNILPSLKEFKDTFLNIGIFMLISLFIKDKKRLLNILIYSLILAFVYNTIKYGFNYYLNNTGLNFSIRLERNYSDYFDLLYPFVLGSLFIIKNKFKYVIGIVLIIGFVELILTGARGAWAAVLGESGLFLLFVIFIKKEYAKKILIFTGISLLLLFSGGYYFYKNSSLIKEKIDQGLKPNGRDMIVKTRLPIFLKHGNFWIGIGGPGDTQYIKFLNKYHAPKKYGKQYKSYFHYYGDEPFLLQIFYKEGILGLIIFLFLSGIFLWQGYKFIKSNYNEKYKFFVLSINSSYIGYYFIRGLVEGRSFKYILLFLTLYLIAKETSNENSISVS